MKHLARTIVLVVGLSLAGCASSVQQTPLQAAEAQVTVEAKAVDLAAVGAKAAYDAGYVKPGSEVEADITVALHASQAAVKAAQASIDAGDIGSAGMYLSQAAAAIGQIAQDITKAKGGP